MRRYNCYLLILFFLSDCIYTYNENVLARCDQPTQIPPAAVSFPVPARPRHRRPRPPSPPRTSEPPSPFPRLRGPGYRDTLPGQGRLSLGHPFPAYEVPVNGVRFPAKGV